MFVFPYFCFGEHLIFNKIFIVTIVIRFVDNVCILNIKTDVVVCDKITFDKL